MWVPLFTQPSKRRPLTTPPHPQDAWVQDFLYTYIGLDENGKMDNSAAGNFGRLKLETRENDTDADVDEYGRLGRQTAIRFSERTGRCLDSYMAYMCWVNFPRCDMSTQESLPMCRSACENMFNICGFPEQMWRCGAGEYFNSQDDTEFVEIASGDDSKEDQRMDPGVKWELLSDGTVREKPLREGYVGGSGENALKRDFFPGQPFKDIECLGSDPDFEECNHKFVCTPSFNGRGVRGTVEVGVVGVAVVGLAIGLWF